MTFLGTADIVYPGCINCEFFMVEAADAVEAKEKLEAWLKAEYKGRRDAYPRKGSAKICPTIK
jgi:hypothetical protein